MYKNDETYPIGIRKIVDKHINLFKHSYLKRRFLEDKGSVIYETESLNFYFKVSPTKSGGDKICFIEYLPLNQFKLVANSANVTPKELDDFFSKWLKLVEENKEYVGPFGSEWFYKKYDKEFYEENKFNEEKYNEPLSLKGQEAALELLEYIQKKTEEQIAIIENEELKNLAQNILEVKENIGGFTKAQVFKIIVRYISIIRKHSTTLFKEVVKKGVTSKILDWIEKGFDNGIKLLE